MTKQGTPRCANLASQVIDEEGPGSILKDFDVLLAFIEEGVRSSGKHHLLPMSRLLELDQLMARPLRPRLKRPQQRSFPNLNALYLFLRATQLGVAEGQGKTNGVLRLDPAMYEQWQRLNPTERYFNLLEAWMRRCTWEMAGHSGGNRWAGLALETMQLWSAIPEGGRSHSKKITHDLFLIHAERACTLAMLGLFGLAEIQWDEPEEGKNWNVTEVRRSPFSEELLPIVFEAVRREVFGVDVPHVAFGAWQPTLQTYFPQWVNNLSFAEPEFRKGVHYFKVSLAGPWRRIAISANSTLDDLADCILRAFDFDGDHLYQFALVAGDGLRICIAHPYIDDAEEHTDECLIGELPLSERQSMLFWYDFGAGWKFDVRLESIDPERTMTSPPEIVESQGEAPPEYGDEDGDYDE